MAEVYLLDWQETKHGQRPEPAEVDAWLNSRGITTVGITKVYANGTVQLAADTDPTEVWPEFAPKALATEDKLGAHIKELVAARSEVMAIPANRRTATERLLLANTALLLFGYGVQP